MAAETVIEDARRVTHDMHFQVDVPLSGILLALVLFIARVRRKYHSNALDTYRARRIEIDSVRPLSVHLDGEMVPLAGSQVHHLSVEVIPAALRVLRPHVYLDDFPRRASMP